MKKLILLLLLFLVGLSAKSNAEIVRAVPESNLHMQLSFAPIVRTASPAVVNIYTTHRVQVRSGFAPLFDDPFFGQFFRGSPEILGERQVNSLGSGVIIKSSGLIVTSLHVVRGADDIRIVLNDKREFSAQIITEDPSSDLALLQIDNKEQIELPKINIADSDALEVGDLVLAIGNPFGVGQTVTSGIVSGLARTAAGVSDYNFFIQTDAAINPGNSGGALVNMNGELVGINTAIYSKSGGSVGVGFAIPARMVEALLKNRKPDGSLIRPYFGATFQDINAEIARSLGLKRVSGVLVDEVASNSPAATAGITSGDVIVAFNDKAIDSAAALQFRIGTAEIEQPLNITYIRQGSVIDRKIILSKTPKSENQNEVFLLKGNHPLNGVAIVTLTPKLAKHLGISAPIDGVVVVQIVNNNGRVFVRTGDIITECNGLVIRSSADLQKALSKYNNNTMSITIIRNGNVMQLRMSN